MRARLVTLAVVAGLAATAAYAVPTVSLYLTSPSNGHTVTPGAAINWAITVSSSLGDNAGLALVCVDLTQDPNNPALFNLPPGDPNSITSTMQHFSRPGGISNPGEGGATTGYIGVQRGTAGAENLVQIGGGQNTFGTPGTIIGTTAAVVGSVGQPGPQLVVTGTFVAPATLGTYHFQITNALANVLAAIAVPPAFSPVTAATVSYAQPTLTITVVAGLKGDANCDGLVNNGDIDAFILALTDSAAYAAQYPGCNLNNSDINNDGLVNNGDIDAFVALITGG